MNIIIKCSKKWSQEDWDDMRENLGILYDNSLNHDSYLVYRVFDKSKFMLAVIKYGIEFEEV
jgi:hypothetical protein